jgi:nitric oxide dioxygenase
MELQQMAGEMHGMRQFVVFRVGGTYCGIPIAAVIEILPVAAITAIPQAPAVVLGMFNFRGRVVSVADFRACLGFTSTPFTSETRVVLVSYRDETVGLLVDAVTEVVTVEGESLQAIKGAPGDTGRVLTTAQLEDRLMLEIDYERALDDGMGGLGASQTLSLAELTRTMEPQAPVDEAGGLDVDLLEASFALLAPRGDELVERFYEILFETAPSVRALFPDDIAGQRRALLGSLGMIVNNLRSPEKLTEYLGGLGERHVPYGAVEAHYDVVGAVLLQAMAELAGDLWTDDLAAAWTVAYGAVKGIMLVGAEAALVEAAA